jgi:hypothetical protein
MSENLPTKPPRQALAISGRSAPLKVSGKLKIAVDRMVHFGDTRAQAAAAAGLKDHSLRGAMRKSHVLAYYRAELAALREGERARNTHALIKVRDKSKNTMAQVQAAKELERSAVEQPPFAGAPTRAGLIFIIQHPAGGAPVVIAPAQAIELTANSEEDAAE